MLELAVAQVDGGQGVRCLLLSRLLQRGCQVRGGDVKGPTRELFKKEPIQLRELGSRGCPTAKPTTATRPTWSPRSSASSSPPSSQCSFTSQTFPFAANLRDCHPSQSVCCTIYLHVSMSSHFCPLILSYCVKLNSQRMLGEWI